MSKYLDNNELFLEPKTTQYGGHMVMTNVMKPTKKKYINIDTRFRDEYNTSTIVNYNITLPERITEVKSMRVTNIEIPNSIFNISSSLGNNSFKIINHATNSSSIFLLPDGNYTATSIINIMYGQLSTVFTGDIIITDQGNMCSLSSLINTYTIHFSVDETGSFDKLFPRSKLGWVLGFRSISYEIAPGNAITSESFIDLNGPRYLYLAVDEFTKGNQHSFISPLPKSFINKNILARISVDNRTWSFGTIFPANRMSGNLVSDHRNYTGKTDLQKLNIQLLNEYGNPVDLNGMDFSFCLEVEHE
jgi:hypothetical protein